MTFREFILYLRRSRRFLLWFLFAVGIFTILFARVAPPFRKASLLISIAQTKTQATADFQYDEFYARETIKTLVEGTKAIFEDPASVNTMLRDAPYERPFLSFGNLFRVRISSNQTLAVVFMARDDNSAAAIGKALSTRLPPMVTERLFNNDEARVINFEMNVSDVIVAAARPVWFLLLIALAMGAIVGVGMLLIRTYGGSRIETLSELKEKYPAVTLFTSLSEKPLSREIATQCARLGREGAEVLSLDGTTSSFSIPGVNNRGSITSFESAASHARHLIAVGTLGRLTDGGMSLAMRVIPLEKTIFLIFI